MTLRAYIEMIQFEDNLFAHKYFYKAACGIVRVSLFIKTSHKLDLFTNL